MATIQVYEAPGRELVVGGDNPSRTTTWIVLSVPSEITAAELVAAASPPVYKGLLRQNVSAKEIALETWECQVPYGPRKPPKENEYKFSFDTTGGKRKITQSLENVARYGKGGLNACPDFKGAIGVTEHGTVEGCEIVVPTFSWSETWQLPIASYGWAYSQKLKAITGKVCSHWFRGFPAGQVLFHGGKGSASSKDPSLIEITYAFEQSDDVKQQTIGDIKAIKKKGFEYLWVRYVEEEATHQERGSDGNLKSVRTLAKRPEGVYIEKVYHSTSFWALGIGN